MDSYKGMNSMKNVKGSQGVPRTQQAALTSLSLPFLARTKCLMFQKPIPQPQSRLGDNSRSPAPRLSVSLPRLPHKVTEDGKLLRLCVRAPWLGVGLGQGAAGWVTPAWVEGLRMGECTS